MRSESKAIIKTGALAPVLFYRIKMGTDLKRIVLGVQYDGQPWLGWQSQPHGQTVQDALQQALQAIATQPVKIYCAGRTDAGVHALEQVVHFDT